jgi:hypothetical protein
MLANEGKKMAKFSNAVQEALLQDAAARAHAMAVPYEALAKQIAIAVEAQKAHGQKAKEERTNLWGAFKQALSIGMTEGHTVSALRVGLEVACEENKVPGGSIRSYINTIENMYREVAEGTLTLTAAEKLSIADARKRYRVVSDAEKVRSELLDVVKNWKVDEVQALIAVARAEADEDEVAEVINVAELHKKEAEEAAARDNAAPAVAQAA